MTQALRSRALRLQAWPLLALLVLLPLGCSGGGGSGSSSGDLQITAINLPQGFPGWQLNRPIRITFNQALQASSVNTNTVNVRQPNGAPAFGTVGVDPNNPNVVVWRPDCPLLDDLSDAGLQPGTTYQLSIIGASQNAGFTIRSKSGSVLELSNTRTFSTPNSALFSDLFVDDAVGPPAPVIRDAGSSLADATYLLIGSTQHYFERQVGGGIALNPPTDLPLNLLSDPATQVELYIQFNQSVDMRSSNINSSRIRWEFEEQPGVWTAITAAVTLESNCTDSGAVVKLVPEGLLPPAANMRAVVAPEFRDIVSEQNLLVQDSFAPMTAESLVGGTDLTDNYLEEFTTSAREDADAPFAEPHADWGVGGELEAKFSFQGTGGPGTDFDWKVGSGEILLLNTVSASIVGGPNFSKQKTQTVIGGVIDVRNVTIEAGGVLRFDGPNPVRILAAGDVVIDGTIDVSGTSSPGVNSLNTTNIPEPGAAGQCGGGRGGTGSPLTTASSPRGGNGTGAFNSLDNGGQGGETGWVSGGVLNERRGAGGGGGRLGANVPDPLGSNMWDQSKIGMDGEDGFDNDEAANGAISGAGPAMGGSLGPSPFVDSNPNNNFFGTMFDTASNQLVIGELKTPWAGAGGGAGGDASRVPTNETFPASNFNPMGDEKGAGGGGGGGSLQILALGDIVFGDVGQIICRGGTGGGGENTIFLNRVGGGSGGGSGGHVILQSAGVIDFSAVTAPFSSILATGGQGGAGKEDKGGAFRSNTGVKETNPANDQCFPLTETGCKTLQGGMLFAPGAGGDGSPGLIQLHTATGTLSTSGALNPDILLDPLLTLADVCSPPPICELGAGPNPGNCYMVPSYGRFSRARSEWIALGNGGFDASTGQFKDVVFSFDGIHTVDTVNAQAGDVRREASGTEVEGLPPILTKAAIQPTGRTLVMDATPLQGTPDDVYLSSPELLRHFLVELYDSNQPTSFLRFDVVSASYDATTSMLTLNFDPTGPAMESFVSTGPVNAELQPAYFRVVTDGIPDFIPASTDVSIFLSATTADVFGNPELVYGVNMDEPLVNLTTDVDDPVTGLNFPGNKDLRFVRFDVLFDIDTNLQGLTPQNPIPALDFFRLGFQYP